MVGKKERILIVGAGPAGIHFGSLLKASGYDNVKVFESANRIGGKSYSIPCHGYQHEMGTMFLRRDYYELISILEKYNIEFKPVKNRDCTFIETPDGVQMLVKKFMRKNSAKSSLKLLVAVGKFLHFRKALFKCDRNGIPKKPDKYVLEFLSMPFGDFAKKQGIEVLLYYLSLSYSLQGYGEISKMPTYYVFYWYSAKLFLGLVKQVVTSSPPISMLPSGFQHVWETIAKKDSLNVNLNIKVRSISRNSNIEKPIVVNYVDSRGNKEEVFDKIILACPPSAILQILKPISSKESQVFGSFSNFYFYNILFSGKYHSNLADLYRLAIFENTPAQGLLAIRHAAGKLVNFDAEQKRGYVAYYFSEKPLKNTNEVRNAIIKQLEGIGFSELSSVSDVLHQYFYHYDSTKINSYYPWRIQDMQGANNTFYIGSHLCYESIKHVLEYNRFVFHKFFAKKY